MVKLPPTQSILTARQRYCAPAKLCLCTISPLCTTCFKGMLVAVAYAESIVMPAIPLLFTANLIAPLARGNTRLTVTCCGGAPNTRGPF
jgi:hypothetical protein